MSSVLLFSLMALNTIVLLALIQYLSKKIDSIDSKMEEMSGMIIEVHSAQRKSYEYDEFRHATVTSKLKSLSEKIVVKTPEEQYGPDGAPVEEQSNN